MSDYGVATRMRQQAQQAERRREASRERAERARRHRDTTREAFDADADFGVCARCEAEAPLVWLGDVRVCDACESDANTHAALRQGLRNGALGAFGMGLATALATLTNFYLGHGKAEVVGILGVMAVLTIGIGYRAWRDGDSLARTRDVFEGVPRVLVLRARLAGVVAVVLGVASGLGAIAALFLPMARTWTTVAAALGL